MKSGRRSDRDKAAVSGSPAQPRGRAVRSAGDPRRAGEDLLRSVVDSTRVILFTLDKDGTVTFPGPLAPVGLAEAPEDRAAIALHHTPQGRDAGQRALAGETLTALIDVDQRIYETRYSPVRNPRGQVAGAIVVAADITERARAERKLAATEGRLYTLVESGPECVVLLGPDATVLELNPAGLSMIEAEAAAAVQGLELGQLVAPAYRPAFQRLVAQVFQGGGGRLEFELLGLRGARRWVEMHAVPQYDADHQIVALMGISRDITQHKRAEAALRESEERHRVLIENSPDAIEVHGDGRFLYVNPTALRLYGARCPRDLLGTPVLDRVHPDSRLEVAARLRQVLELRSVTPPREQKIVRLDGEVITVEALGAPIEYRGQPAVQMVLRDVTERRRIEEALRESERRFAAFINNSCAIAWMKDQRFNYVYVNESFERAFQTRADLILGRSDFDLWPEATARVIRRRDQAVLETGKGLNTYETRPGTDSQAREWWVFRFPFSDARQRRYVGGMAVDVDERRLQRQLLETRNAV